MVPDVSIFHSQSSHAHKLICVGQRMTVIPEKAPGLGWKPTWDRAKFLQSMDDEVEAARSVDTEKLRSA